MLQPERLQELFFVALGDPEMFEGLVELCIRHEIDPVPFINKAEEKAAEFRKLLNGSTAIVSNRKTRIPLLVSKDAFPPC